MLNQGVNWTLCPIDRPFLINGSKTCEQCPSDRPIYNLSSTLCINCPVGTAYSANEMRCVSTQCSNGKYYNFDAKVCLCPQAQPFEDASGNCISCLLPRYYNKATKTCDTCPSGSYYDLTRATCVMCSPETPLSTGLGCYGCNNGFIYNQTSKSCQCPAEKPFTDGLSCYSCFFPNFWNTFTLKCESCSNNTVFDTTQGKCLACPADRPVILNGQCIGCPIGTKAVNGICINDIATCGAGQFYNSTSKRCECSIVSQYFNTLTQRCEDCPDSAPILYNGVCSYCPTGTVYNKTYQRCLSCTNGLVYNNITHKCDQVCPTGAVWSN